MKKWCISEAFGKAIQDHRNTALASSPVLTYQEGESIPIEAWEAALIKTANFVDRWGEAYLPLFERVEQELDQARERLVSLEKARSIARGEPGSINIAITQQSDSFEP